MTQRNLKICFFAPEERDNPYLLLLSLCLKDLEHEVAFVQACTPQWLWRNRGKIDVLHFHWVQYFYNSPHLLSATLWSFFFFFRLLIARSLGYRIFWTVHNIMPHERAPGPADLIARLSLIMLAEAVVVHCRLAETALRDALCRKKNIHVIPHGHYMGWYPGNHSKQDARGILDIPIDEYVYLYFGAIRPYKGIEALINSFKGLPSGYLIIAGRPCDVYMEKKIRRIVENHPRIRLRLTFVSEEEVQILFECADSAVFPFTDVLTSGSVILGLSMGKPVIVPKVGCLPELVQESLGILFNPDEPTELSKAMTEIRQRCYDAGAIKEHMKQHFGWPRIAQRHLVAYGVEGRTDEL